MVQLDIKAPDEVTGHRPPKALAEERKLAPIKWFRRSRGRHSHFRDLHFCSVAYLRECSPDAQRAVIQSPRSWPSRPHAQEVLFTSVALFMFYRYRLQAMASRRSGWPRRYSLLIVCSLMYWQEPVGRLRFSVCHHRTVSSGCNTALGQEIFPGYLTPNGHLFVEPPLFSGAAYPAWVLRRCRSRLRRDAVGHRPRAVTSAHVGNRPWSDWISVSSPMSRV